MRSELADPISNKARLRKAASLAETLYRRYEAGEELTPALDELSALVGRPISKGDVCGAFGSVSPETFARTLLMERAFIPKDLTRPEMLELIERICSAEGTEFQLHYWLDVLEVNTGDTKLSDLIYWPGEYFGDSDNSREMTAEEILTTALAARNTIIALPPPAGSLDLSKPDCEDPEVEEQWCLERRAEVERYLRSEGVEHGEIGEWPAWHVAPYVSIWAIESRKYPGSVGWWAIAGDLPTDYVSAKEIKHPREAMCRIAEIWTELAECMQRGERHPHVYFDSSPERQRELAPLLKSRAEILLDWATDDAMWVEDDDEDAPEAETE